MLPTDFWHQRVAAAYAVRQGLGLIADSAPRRNNTYRLIHGEGDFVPGLVVDVYADTAVMQAHSVGVHCCRKEIAEAIVKEVPEVKNVYYKSDDTLPFKASVEGDKVGYLIREKMHDDSLPFWATENGLDLWMAMMYWLLMRCRLWRVRCVLLAKSIWSGLNRLLSQTGAPVCSQKQMHLNLPCMILRQVFCGRIWLFLLGVSICIGESSWGVSDFGVLS